MSYNHTVQNEVILKEVCRCLSEGKCVKLRPKGSSMRPCIRDGLDIVMLAPILTLRLGYIVLARLEDSRYVLHRIVGFDNGEIIIMGDANLYGQERCRIEDVFGIAVCLLRNDRRISLTSTGHRIMALVRHKLLPLRRIIRRITSILNSNQL